MQFWHFWVNKKSTRVLNGFDTYPEYPVGFAGFRCRFPMFSTPMSWGFFFSPKLKLLEEAVIGEGPFFHAVWR